MVAAPLVEPFIEAGRKLVEALDRASFPIEAAVWRYFPDASEWRLVIASKLVDQVGPRETYKTLQPLLGTDLSLRDVSVVSPQDDFVRLLRKAIRTGPGISSIRFTGNTIDGVFIEDALIYRL